MADTSVPQTDDFAPDCQDRRCDDCRAEDCTCGCHLAEDYDYDGAPYEGFVSDPAETSGPRGV